MKKTEPRTLPGFMELLPTDQILFNKIKDIIRETYEIYGFLPLDTPEIELSEVLLAKAGGETEKQIYRFNKGDSDLSLRFDLTVPLAKYVAKNCNELAFPFRRYQIGKVFRGERPQKGRYREFYQCDIDVIGDEKLDVINDAELPAIIYTIFTKLNLGKFVICLNNRKILNGLFDYLGLKEKAGEILVTVDKLPKIGRENVIYELEQLEVEKEKINYILDFVGINGSQDEMISKLEELNIENEIYNKDISELKEVVKYVRKFGVPDENFKLDLSISRGLDYYTGTVYETFLTEHREIGSVCSGGRYEDLAGLYIDKKMPGVGISIGLTRLFYCIKELNLLSEERKSMADLLIISMNEELDFEIDLANKLREKGAKIEIYLNNKKLKAKMKYADKLEIPFVTVIGENEINSNTIKIKNMKTGEETEVGLDYDKIMEIIK